jgi:SAM-dependent methyltransferase
MDRTVSTAEDVFALLDGLFASRDAGWATGDGATFWDRFYANRSRPVPFFVAKPDESLTAYLDRGLITHGRALDLGCGPGRNGLFLASQGFEVDAVDLSPAAIARAEDGIDRFVCGDAFQLADRELTVPYDLVVDSGRCRHLPPHRTVSYLALLDRVLALGGHLALTCFAAGSKGSELTDADIYRELQLQGDLAHTPESLRWIYSDLTEVELRRIVTSRPSRRIFGEALLWTALFRSDER